MLERSRSFGRDRRGATIVEFALVATPFFLLLCGVLETGVVFFGSSVLEKATLDAARLVRTGQVQTGNMTQQQFHDYICGEISPLLPCSGLQVDVEAFDSFDDVVITPPIDANGNLDTDLTNYATGHAGDIVLVRTFYTWNIVTPLISPLLANLSNGKRLLTSTAAFRNEPF
jgi:Flp pilus assembly protein TadG